MELIVIGILFVLVIFLFFLIFSIASFSLALFLFGPKGKKKNLSAQH